MPRTTYALLALLVTGCVVGGDDDEVILAAAASPSAGPLFNDPLGALVAKRRIADHIERLIAGAPAGSTIRIATLHFNAPATAAALIDAYDRGVNVKVILSEGKVTDSVDDLTAALGTDTEKGSFVKTCVGSCLMDAGASIMHDKIFLFSRTGDASKVAVTSSANLSDGMALYAWNDAFTTIGDDAIYSALANRLDRMRHDRTPDSNPYATVDSGNQRYFLFPDAAFDPDADLFDQIIGNIKCTGATGSAGSSGKTIVRLGFASWSRNELDVASAVGDLVDRGCVVRLVTNAGGLDPEAQQMLLNRKVPTRTVERTVDGNRYYMHSKFIAISGVYNDDPSSFLVFAGSANMGINAFRSDNFVMRIRGETVHGKYANHHAALWNLATPLSASSMGSATADDGDRER